jgi:2-methylaconitate cis-trans-isomerase PrpF
MARPVRCVIMRGGTSKAVFLRAPDLPASPEARLKTILAIFGSPDKRQIDGLGGADPLTSKVAIIGPVRAGNPRAAHTHLTYTFGQVEIAEPEVDYISLCGNISSAVGAYAVYEGFVEPTEPITVVRVYNTNLDRVLTLEVPVEGGRPKEYGDYAVPASRHRCEILGICRTRPAERPARCCHPAARSIVWRSQASVPLTCRSLTSATPTSSCARATSAWPGLKRRPKSTPTPISRAGWNAFAAPRRST